MYTKGPWKWIDGGSVYFINVPDINRKPGQPEYRALGEIRALDAYNPTAEDRANARLIASAPELLEACKAVTAELVAIHDESCQHCEAAPYEPAQESPTDYCPTVQIIRRAKAAIAKAEGK